MDPYETKIVNDTEDDIDRFFGATGNGTACNFLSFKMFLVVIKFDF